MNLHDVIKVYTDGGSRGNPGHAAIGVIIVKDKDIIHEYSEYLGVRTNNQAEYTAIIKALEICKELFAGVLHVYSDSQLVVRQLNNMYKIKNKKLFSLYMETRKKERGYQAVYYHHVPRETECIAKADALVNECLDCATSQESRVDPRRRTHYCKP